MVKSQYCRSKLWALLPWPISVTQPIYKINRLISAHVVLFASSIILFQPISSYLRAILSYFSSCCLICKLYHPISTHVVLFAAYLLLFSSCIILFQASASSYFHPLHHPIYNSYHLIYNWYYNLFANTFPAYLHLCHAILIICPIFSPSKPIVLFLEICLYKIVIATRNSLRHFDKKRETHYESCLLTNNVTITPYIQNHFIWGCFVLFEALLSAVQLLVAHVQYAW